MKNIKEFEKWFRHAEADLKTARNSLKSKDYYASIFWCQQSVEKGLKALMISRGKGLIRVHDLVKLGKEVDLPERFFDISARLSVMYSDVRYPIFRDFERKEVDSFIKFAEEVLEWIKERI